MTMAVYSLIGHPRSTSYQMPSTATLMGQQSKILISSKCITVLIYGLEACRLLKSDLLSLDFVVNRFFMKLLVST